MKRKRRHITVMLERWLIEPRAPLYSGNHYSSGKGDLTMGYHTDISPVPQHRYAVLQRVKDEPKQVGIVLANNYGHATTKAMQLFNRHVWVERLSTQ